MIISEIKNIYTTQNDIMTNFIKMSCFLIKKRDIYLIFDYYNCYEND